MHMQNNGADRRSEFLYAAEKGDIETVDKLCSGLDNPKVSVLEAEVFLNQVNTTGKTALILAATEGNKDIVRHLLRRGADTTITCKGGWTAKQYAQFKNRRGIIEILEEYMPAPSKAS